MDSRQTLSIIAQGTGSGQQPNRMISNNDEQDLADGSLLRRRSSRVNPISFFLSIISLFF